MSQRFSFCSLFLFLLLFAACSNRSTEPQTSPTAASALEGARDEAGIYQNGPDRSRVLYVRPRGGNQFEVELTGNCNFRESFERRGDQLVNADGSATLQRYEGAIRLSGAFVDCATSPAGDYAPLNQLQSHIPSGYVFPPDSLWVLAEQREPRNQIGDSYNTEILTSGDYDGDGTRDYAVIAYDTTGRRIRVYAFHGLSGSFESYEVYSLGALSKTKTSPQAINAGLDTRGPGRQQGYSGQPAIELSTDALIVKFYDQAQYLFFWQNGQYNQLLLSSE